MSAAYIIDRRLGGKNRSAVNRDRFMRRYREQIKEAVRDLTGERPIADKGGGEIRLKKKTLSEPSFQHGHGGVREGVYPGNDRYLPGDTIERPMGGAGQGGKGNAGPDGQGEDDFVFQISREEFLDYFFEDLALPNLVRTKALSATEFSWQPAGYVADGTPTNLHVVRSMRNALGRRLALGGPIAKEIEEKERELAALEAAPTLDTDRIAILQKELESLRRRRRAVPWIDTFDLRYRNRVKVPKPTTQAVMFCIMDVSGSMDKNKKDLAKRFFTLLYLFLTRNYEKVELVFIRHHVFAEEVDENTFFYSRESGGTVVSSALTLMKEILGSQRFPPGDWNVYLAQASDGDNWREDSGVSSKLLGETLMPLLQYAAYVEVGGSRPQELWDEYEKLLRVFPNHFGMRRIETSADIWPVFRALFARENTKA